MTDNKTEKTNETPKPKSVEPTELSDDQLAEVAGGARVSEGAEGGDSQTSTSCGWWGFRVRGSRNAS